jgi:hypothetical protein
VSGVEIFFLLLGIGLYCLIHFYSEKYASATPNETTNNEQQVETLDSILKDYIGELKQLNQLSIIYNHESSRLNHKNRQLDIPRFKFEMPEITKIVEGDSFQILFTTSKDDEVGDIYEVNITLHMDGKKIVVLEASYGYDFRVHSMIPGPWFVKIKETMKSHLNAARSVNSEFKNSFEEQRHRVLETIANAIKELANTYNGEVQHV